MARQTPVRVIAHLSDVHLRPASDPFVGGVVDADARLARAIDVLTGWDVACDAWLFTGDLSDTGTADTYERLRDAVTPAAQRCGVRVLWANGNHDDRSMVAQVLLGEDASGPLDRAYDVDGLRVLTLDSCVPGDAAGLISDASLDWLASQLATPAPLGTLVALHHPPILPVQDAASWWDLRNPGALASVLEGSDVRLIVGGHFHQTSFTTLAGIPVASVASLTYAQDLTAGRTLRGQDAHTGFNLLEFHDSAVTVTAVHLDASASVHPAISPAEVASTYRD